MNGKIMSLLLVISSASAMAQDTDAVGVQLAVQSKNFIFKAESVTPQRGSTRHLTPEYEIVIKPDTIISYLPYFGRSYSAPIDPSEGGIKFTSSDFEYTIGKKKKKSWEITVKLKDVSDVQNMYFSIFENGSASVRVVSNKRESISFNGTVQEGKAFE
jgi:hypothetical protein